jgi:hypothetical protein
MNGWLRRVAVVHWEVHRSQQQSLRWLRPLCIRPAILLFVTWRWGTGQRTAPNDNRCVVCDRRASDRRSFQLFVPSGVQGA